MGQQESTHQGSFVRTVGNGLHNTRSGDGAAVQHAALHRLLAHRIAVASVKDTSYHLHTALGHLYSPQNTRIRRQARDGNTDVIVNADKLLLVRGELARRALEREQHGVRLGAQTDGCGTLLDGLERVLDLVQLALRRLGLVGALTIVIDKGESACELIEALYRARRAPPSLMPLRTKVVLSES